MRFQAVVFDLDGTLLDTLEDLRDATNFAMRAHGYPERTLAEMRGFVGNGVRLLIERAMPEGEGEAAAEACLADFTREYDLHMNVKTRPYPGIPEALAALKARGVRAGVVSNKYDSAAKALVKAHFGDLVDLCLGTFPDVPPKPAPDTTRMLLAELRVAPAFAAYVGDSGVDAQTAENAGLPFFGVNWGFWGRERLLRSGATRLFDDAPALVGALLSEQSARTAT